MPSFFSFRVAPGVRISASSRGVRAHLGPRAARLHVGGGGTGVSTGAGPFTHYQSLAGRPSGRPQGSSAPNADQKAAEAQRIDAVLQTIGTLHLAQFAPPARATADLPALPPLTILVERAEAHHLAGVGLLRRTERRAARSRARDAAELHARHLLGDAVAEQRRAQDEIDDAWQRLADNDEDTLLPALESAFDDNQAPAAAVSIVGDTVHVVVLVPGPDAVPDRVPSVTRAGNVSLKAASKTALATVYRDLVAGHVLLSAKEALTVGVGLTAVAVVAARREWDGRLSCLLATRLERDVLHVAGTPWEALEERGTGTVVNLKGLAKALTPLDLTKEPELRALVDACALD